jgi:hypothetical protein
MAPGNGDRQELDMDIASGLTGLKTAVDLTSALRDAAKCGSLKPDEFAGRVGRYTTTSLIQRMLSPKQKTKFRN